jgi:hypothetical protein
MHIQISISADMPPAVAKAVAQKTQDAAHSALDDEFVSNKEVIVEVIGEERDGRHSQGP